MPLVGADALIDTLRERNDQLVRGLALEATKGVVLMTPVDEGRARGNWNVATGSPDKTESEERKDKDGGPTIGRALTIVREIQVGDTIFITNSVPYILPLEDGHSSQAPQGMIALTAARLQPLADQIAARIRSGGQ